MLRTLLLSAVVLTATLAVLGQKTAPTTCLPPLVPDLNGLGCHMPTPEETSRTKQLEKARNKQRYQDLQRDSARLLELATQLKQEVDAAGKDTLAVDVVKKADEIEKLAKSVKQKMKGD